MSDSSNPVPAPSEYHALPALLSYLVPGLGQIYQGRIAKGVLFFVCLYVLFFYGMFMGSGSATLPSDFRDPESELITYRIHSNVYLPDAAKTATNTRLPPLAYNLYTRPQFLGQVWIGIAAWPAIYQYSTYDDTKPTGGAPFGNYMRAPSEATVNAVHTMNHKSMDLGWVYTVLAGVLNILVIYDALAGPALLASASSENEPSPQPAT